MRLQSQSPLTSKLSHCCEFKEIKHRHHSDERLRRELLPDELHLRPGALLWYSLPSPGLGWGFTSCFHSVDEGTATGGTGTTSRISEPVSELRHLWNHPVRRQGGGIWGLRPSEICVVGECLPLRKNGETIWPQHAFGSVSAFSGPGT